MIKYTIILFISLLLFSETKSVAQDTTQTITDSLQFNGQLSTWGNYNFSNQLPLHIGIRYIPTLNYKLKLPNYALIDFEGSANMYGSTTSHPFDTIQTDGSISPYRAWMRYSNKQTEIRLGLQKINFGSATLLRPLMWFDQLDPRDPLKLTNGVWGLLGRYYFLNNANVWLWCLYGNTKQRPWDIGATTNKIPELGTRIQLPIKKGEMALSYHFRKSDASNVGFANAAFSNIPENRIGLDAKWDLGFGLWFEATWITKSKNIGMLTNQELLNIGIDNTVNVGNGLNIVFEQLFAASDDHAFAMHNTMFFSASSLNYPLTMFDNINAIVYYDWKSKASYNFINWNHKFKYISFFLMSYWNPKNYQLPQQGTTNNLFAGKGFQIMLVYNH